MDLQTRKLNLIEYLIRLQDEKMFKIIEDSINKSMKTNDKEIKPFTQEELISRANESNANYLNGDTKTQDQLETESKDW